MKKLLCHVVRLGAAALLLSGCANPERDRAQAAAVGAVQNLSITCMDAADCNIKWAKALQWVSDNSIYKLRLATDAIITTEGPLDVPGYTTQSGMTVNRVPRPNGSAEIVFRSGCANEFGCFPTHEMLLTSFAQFVSPETVSVAAQASRATLGVGMVALDAKGIAAIHLPSDHGVMVILVGDNTPASRAGLQKSDVILSFGGTAMSSTAGLQQAVRAISPGSVISIHIWRGGKELDLNVQL